MKLISTAPSLLLAIVFFSHAQAQTTPKKALTLRDQNTKGDAMKTIALSLLALLAVSSPSSLKAQLLDKKALTLEAAEKIASAAADMPMAKAAAPKVSYFPAAQVNKAFVKGMPLLEIANYKIHASHRDAPGIVEIHTKDIATRTDLSASLPIPSPLAGEGLHRRNSSCEPHSPTSHLVDP
jgi:hypothetical protein